MIRFTRITGAILLLFIFVAARNDSDENTRHYNLNTPSSSTVLPDILMEVSGLTYLGPNTIACVQDENGVIFNYDLLKSEISKQYRFNIDGDYEGITKVDKNLFVLRSDGVLFEISDYDSPKSRMTTYTTGIPALNSEGLCYDKDNNRLLIAVKGKTAKGPESKDKRVIYGFDLKTKKLSASPVFDFDVQKIKQFAIENKINLPIKVKKQGQISEPVLRFATSEICIHPISKKLYLLSAADHLFMIFDLKGNLEHMEPLDPVLFNKAEGLTFAENGDMMITNEGQYKKPTLLLFRYTK
ncbi:MAG: hypothetical protein K0Q95_639 [Bacteroidota bacterium]|jgi:uncharacterized protein YjiK|nr:hypothetical protein [Bacteroidota bacterium]